MQEDEAEIHFERLARTLSDGGLSWIVEDVKAAISLGNIVEKEARTGKMKVDAESGKYRVASGRKREKMIATIPYTEVEKLRLLVDAAANSLREIGLRAYPFESGTTSCGDRWPETA
ncbi:hypothetical protein [Roseospira navarrensis]|uniref:Uncharacterized protein n=1 Tax=Roseospira navarrensis TaxID=140058 RepID=A0A7X1ZHF4_9PROT|nr:hypothetical protein [Roseospira navarrensis]MQX38427.1 hypothetical protein [Roseospira navarrensis]